MDLLPKVALLLPSGQYRHLILSGHDNRKQRERLLSSLPIISKYFGKAQHRRHIGIATRTIRPNAQLEELEGQASATRCNIVSFKRCPGIDSQVSHAPQRRIQ